MRLVRWICGSWEQKTGLKGEGEVSRKSGISFVNMAGSGLGVVLLSTGIILALFLTFVSAVDYGLFSMKNRLLQKGMESAAAAAVQEVDIERSREGLSGGYDEITGALSLKGIYLDPAKANKAFFSTLEANIGLYGDELREHLLTVCVSPDQGGLECRFSKGSLTKILFVPGPDFLQEAINTTIDELFPGNAGDDRRKLKVNGNRRTNDFRNRPYFIAFVRGYEIKGLFKNRDASFACFSGAKIGRKQ